VVTCRHAWGEDRVYYRDAEGKLRSLPTAWTSLFVPDPFVALAAGRSAFRLEDLRGLRRLLDVLCEDGGLGAGSKGEEDV